MSTAVVPQPPTPASGTSPSGAATSGAPAASPASTAPVQPTAQPEWRVPQTDSRVWARGKTASEVLDIAGQLEGVVRNYATAPTPPTAPPANPTQPGFTGDEYVRGDDLNRTAPALINAQVEPRFAALNEQMASMALNAVRSEFADDFQKYGPEIYGKLSTLNKQTGAWTVDNLRTVVRMVRADHVEDIVRERLNAASPMEPALRSTGAAPVSVTPVANDFSVNSAQLPPEYREKLAKANITDATMQEFCRANNMSVEDFFKMVARGQTITEAPRR